MYSEYQEEFLYFIVWCVVIAALLATAAVIYSQGFLHPIPDLTDAEVEHVVGAVTAFFRQ